MTDPFAALRRPATAEDLRSQRAELLREIWQDGKPSGDPRWPNVRAIGTQIEAMESKV